MERGAAGGLTRRRMLGTTAFGLAMLVAAGAKAEILSGTLPWIPGAPGHPEPVRPGDWQFFTYDEARAIEAMVDRLIPPDDLSLGGKESGCAVYLDRQLAGPYGRSERLYMSPPFARGTPQQGPQSEDPPAIRYRKALAAVDAYCKGEHGGKGFAELGDGDKDAVLQGLEKGEVTLDGADAKGFFAELLTNTMEGFFADPLYGGNKDMTAWKMIGFPGARYDYRDFVTKHNQPYPLPPVSILGRADWNRS